jgi:hypothetical protein
MTSDVRELSDLVGCALSTVAFVRDYVEFRFDGPILRSLAPPVVTVDGIHVEFPREGSRDALCELIGRLVEDVKELPDRLLVNFADSAIVEIPRHSKEAGPEVAHFVPMLGGEYDLASMITWENLLSG